MRQETRAEKGDVHESYWEAQAIEAFKSDPMKILIELIKNSADSYTNFAKNKNVKPPFEICVTLHERRGKAPHIEVLDNAEGMNAKKLKDALEYGARTSQIDDSSARTSAEKGIGLKDALIALDDNRLTSISDGLINERKKRKNFWTVFYAENEKITPEERAKLHIKNNGTLIVGTLPDYFKVHSFDKIYELLQKHYLLRKLLLLEEFKVYVINGTTKTKKLLKYEWPKEEKQVLEEEFVIDYEGNQYKGRMIVKKALEKLRQDKPYGDSGLLIYYGNYSVLDCTLGRFDRDPSFAKFFGIVDLDIGELIKKIRRVSETSLVDQKRRGLNLEHPFNKKLLSVINDKLKELELETEETEHSFDEEKLKAGIKEINQICKDVKGRGPPAEPPIKPQMFEFVTVFEDKLKEYEPKRVALVINSWEASKGLKINIASTNKDIKTKTSEIKIENAERSEKFIIKTIELYSEVKGAKGDIVASSQSPAHYTRMGVEVIENPMLHPKDGFAFVPNKTTIIDEGQKEVILCVNKALLSADDELKLSASNPADISNEEKSEEKTIEGITMIPVPIKVNGKGHIGENAIVEAEYGGKKSELKVVVVPEPSLSGLLRGVRPSGKDTLEICSFIKEEGVLELYVKHSLIKQYLGKKNITRRPESLVFIADTFTRKMIEALVESGIEENSSRFRLLDLSHPENEIEDHKTREYYETGPGLHKAFISLTRGLR